MARLRKADVEDLLGRFDADPVGALATALRRVLDMPQARWNELLDASGLDDARLVLLRSGDQRALDELAAELNEQRALPPGSR